MYIVVKDANHVVRKYEGHNNITIIAVNSMGPDYGVHSDCREERIFQS